MRELHFFGWCGLAVAAVYFCLATLALRWRPRRESEVVRYEPPAGISPAMACYLVERGNTDKAVAVALVSMAARGYLRIEQGPHDYLLSRLNPSVPLEAEEDLIADALFGREGLPVRLSQFGRLGKVGWQVRELLQSTAEPELISPHFWFYIPGLTISLWCFLAALTPEIEILWKSDGTVGIFLPALFAVGFLLAAIRTLPALFSKLRSLLPGTTPHHMRFVERDTASLFLLLAAIGSLAVVGWATSPQFGMLLAGYIVVNILAWTALRWPTAAGTAVLHELSNFRTFLSAVDSDPINRMNTPNATSAPKEKYWAWALALNVEHTWGEQFAAAVLNRLGPQSAINSIERNLPEQQGRSAELLDLHLR